MLVGTGSDVGKSFIATGLCRLFLQDGFHPTPYKALNLSPNFVVTSDGKEMGLAQAVQAEAAGLCPHHDMNPLFIRPNEEGKTEVVLHGKVLTKEEASSYYDDFNRNKLREEVRRAYDRLSEKYHPLVLEGSGSISELNLRNQDFANMEMALYAGAVALLVADIERGGLFGTVYGTLELLTPEERGAIKGIIINKFRGNPDHFSEGKKMLEDLCQVPVIGIVPHLSDVSIPEEDSKRVALLPEERAVREKSYDHLAMVLRHALDIKKLETLMTQSL